jgi:hypothetical protein
VGAIVKLSVVVMAHKKRRRFVDELLPHLPGAEVVWDERNDRIDTGRRSLLAHPADADWALTVQDDALLCPDFLPGVEELLAHVPEVPVSFYAGAVRPHGRLVTAAVARAKAARRPFVAMPGPMWGVATALPVPLIEDMLEEYGRLRGIANFDMRMTTHFARRKILCWHTVPSLVNHRVGPQNPSLVPGRGSAATRVAHEFIGGRSPLDIDWSRGALVASEFHQSRQSKTQRRRTPMARIAPRVLYGIDGVGVRRRIRAGSRIPPGLRLEEEVDFGDRSPPEARRVEAERAGRAKREAAQPEAEPDAPAPLGAVTGAGAKGATEADRRSIQSKPKPKPKRASAKK